ncbi:MAG: FtsK/SpoIIIE domain-containing protein [Actinomycetaceae bacterium]|nr:FtsK/SpoIIIE domain-containing protein [Actinomycetaceae bacterium]
MIGTMHLAAIAGPDSGQVVELDGTWKTVGRAGEHACIDKQTSRAHFQIRLRRSANADSARPPSTGMRKRHETGISLTGKKRGGESAGWIEPATASLIAQIQDLDSANGTYRLRPLRILPKAGYRLWWARRTREVHLRVGECMWAGANVWQLRRAPTSLALTDLIPAEASTKRARNWRWLYLLLPALSLSWLLGRWLAGQAVLLALTAVAAAVGYGVWRHHTRRLLERLDAARIVFGFLQLMGEAGSFRGEGEADSFSTERVPNTHRPWTIDLTASTQVVARTLQVPWRKRDPHSPLAKLAIVRLKVSPTRSESVGVGDTLRVLATHEGWETWVATQVILQARARGLDPRFRLAAQTWSVYAAGGQQLITLTSSRAQTQTRAGTPPRIPQDAPAWERQRHTDHLLNIGGRAPHFDLGSTQWAQPETQRPNARSHLPTAVQTSALPGIYPPLSQGQGERGLKATIGIGNAGPVTIDLAREGPHVLVAGTTGSGKSEALRTWLWQLVRRYHPDALRLVLIDYKGGAGLGEFSELPHCEGVFTDLDEARTTRVFHALRRELKRREQELAARRLRDIAQWEEQDRANAPARLLCVIDEFRALVQTHPHLMEQCIDLAARGRSLGMHLIAATQSPAGVVSPQIRANLTMRVCLRVAQVGDSMDVLGSDLAVKLPPVAGRALLDSGSGVREVQWALTSGETAHKIAASAATAASGRKEVTRLWQPPMTARQAATWLQAHYLESAGVTGAAEVVNAENSPRAAGGSTGPAASLAGSDAGAPLAGSAFAVAEDPVSGQLSSLDLSQPVVALANDRSRRALFDQVQACLPSSVRIGHAGPAHRSGHWFIPVQEVNTAAPALRVAAENAVPILIEDLATWWAHCDYQWGTGMGEKLWQTLQRHRRAQLLVGAAVEDITRMRTFTRQLLCAPPNLATSLGLGREVGSALTDAAAFSDQAQQMTWVTTKWDDLPVSRVVPADPQGGMTELNAPAGGSYLATHCAPLQGGMAEINAPAGGGPSGKPVGHSRRHLSDHTGRERGSSPAGAATPGPHFELQMALQSHLLTGSFLQMVRHQRQLPTKEVIVFPGAESDPSEREEVASACAAAGWECVFVEDATVLAQPNKYRRLMRENLTLWFLPSAMLCRILQLPCEVAGGWGGTHLWAVCSDLTWRVHLSAR